jgi:hypothetical protein
VAAVVAIALTHPTLSRRPLPFENLGWRVIHARATTIEASVEQLDLSAMDGRAHAGMSRSVEVEGVHRSHFTLTF